MDKPVNIRWVNAEDGSMHIHRKGELLWLSFPGFDSETWLRNGFSTRLGGVSTGPLATMNLDWNRGDDPENVRENYRRMADAIGFDTEDLVFAQQTHTTNVRRVGREDRGKGFSRPLPWTDVDGLITDEPGVVLTTVYADCVPLYFADPVHHAIGLSHSGWRGTAAGMGRVTVEAMTEAFGSDPNDIIAAIGPCICQDCYEVTRDVAQHFQKGELKAGRDAEHFQLDLAGANRRILVEAGIPASRIFAANLCTCCNPKLLFSHRYTHGRRGEMAAFLEINEINDRA